MKHLIKRLSKISDSSSSTYTLLRSDFLLSHRPPRGPTSTTRRRTVPSGHVPVLVGDEMARFVVSADVMNHPVFVKLLNISAQEYGYDQKGALRIPCNVVVFEKILRVIRHGGDFSADVLDFINSFLSSTDDF
ncbi:hypothetical protein RND81_03G095600 [Saponaria officinalis]|uniref:Uncharacterized protein n=1 Tax=Saponaria officinalis TaxID=3572 RepID=A0AAW1M4Y6_SAPOF